MNDLEKIKYSTIILAVILVVVSLVWVFNELSNENGDVLSGEAGSVNASGMDEVLKELLIVKDKSDYSKEEIIASLESDFRNKVSVSSDSESDSLVKDIYVEMDGLMPQLTGAGADAKTYDIVLEPLPNNPVITKSKYLGRDYGLVVNIECSGQKGILSDTAWWYSSAATQIAKAVFDSEIGSQVGVLGIVINEPDKEREITFILYAADAEQLRPYWKEERSSIRVSDWSDVDMGNADLVMYEDPSSSVEISPGHLLYSDVSYLDDEIDIDSLIADSSYEILKSFDDVNIAVGEKNYNDIISSSETLLSSCLKQKKKFVELLSVNVNSINLKDYIEALDYFSAAGSDYWYGSVYLDMDRIREGNQYFLQGSGSLEQIAGITDDPVIIKGQLPEVVTSSVVNFYPLNTPVHYQDPSGCNDISINVEGYKLASNLQVKDGNSISQVNSKYGSTFVAAVIDIYHLGYRGGSTQTVSTPPKTDFVLIYDGVEYKDVTPSYYLRNLGEAYQQKTLNRLEHYESNLVFEVEWDGEFNPDLASLKVDLGDKWGEHIWKFTGT